MNRAEYKPASKPRMIGTQNSRMVSLPRIARKMMVTIVVPVEYTVRVTDERTA